jgi:hypothetical protein
MYNHKIQMSVCSTVDTIHTCYLRKIEIIGKCFDLSLPYTGKFKPTTLNRYNQLFETFKKTQEDYQLEVVPVLSKYYNNDPLNVRQEYTTRVESSGYNGKLDQCMFLLSALQKKFPTIQSQDIITEYSLIKVVLPVGRIPFKVATCGTVMEIFPSTSELICPCCGETSDLVATVFEDTQFYSQEGKRSKHGCYDPTRHCKFWVSRIQARESREAADISSVCLKAVAKCARRDLITDGRLLTCIQIRSYLKETHFTEYNDHVPLIKKRITGITPPQLTTGELRKLYNYFDKSVNAFELVKPHGKSNTMYYPYIIYKILDNVLKDGNRKNKILECIHLQSRDTLITNDHSWSLICAAVVGLNYRPTDRNEYIVHM